ncbi:DUF3089 domain-containing protein [Sphingomonas sp.]|uniref:DUF3089 domain-containing protein n=1 Tax=Sphingomonas sp. TaxID=28214 RepID=UPI0017DDC95E|nr:DUF3089 domain-containing protein [Sphingomonas sp.]MBA3512550.1 DUF3089 domain-containing protein [Sphingomonas sp.]
MKTSVIGYSMLAILTALAGAPAAAQPVAAPDYSKASSWLCMPGRSDSCSKPLPTTALNPNGYGSTGLSPVAVNPPVDCFYVYPTVSRDRGMNSDLFPDASEASVVQSQFARFAGACRTFTPLYRQLTVSAIAASAIGANLTAPSAIAYRDVAAAWRRYLAVHNKGRPFVLVGHSQGSALLQELIRREIEGKPVARQMLRAILPGFNVLVPQGRRVGGSFKSTPLCGSPDETGCVMTWVSYRENNVPPAGAMFGMASPPGMTVGCTNPARPGSTRWESFDSYWNTRLNLPVPGGPIVWSTEGRPPTPFLRTEGLVSGRCVNNGPRGYLSVRTNADPRDKRTDRIGGEVGMLGMFIPGWGMHLADIPIAQGDLVRAVEELGRTRR